MPNFYTHYSFGKRVIEKLSPNIRDIIRQNEDIFIFGNQGPNLFFYHILSTIRGDNPGQKIEDTKFEDFVNRSRYNLLKLGMHSSSSAYFFGVSCNFLLSSKLSPVIDSLSSPDYNSLDIASELDRFYLEEDGYDEYKMDQASLLPSPDIGQYLYPIYASYPTVSKEIIEASIKNMRLIKKLFQSRGGTKESIILSLLKISGTYEKFSGHLIKQTPFKESYNTNTVLSNLYKETLTKTPEFLDQVFSYLYEGGYKPQEFKKNFKGL